MISRGAGRLVAESGGSWCTGKRYSELWGVEILSVKVNEHASVVRVTLIVPFLLQEVSVVCSILQIEPRVALFCMMQLKSIIMKP